MTAQTAGGPAFKPLTFKHTFPVNWYGTGTTKPYDSENVLSGDEAASEYTARAIVLALDRIKEFGGTDAMVGMDRQPGMTLQFSHTEYSKVPAFLESLTAEVRAIPTLGRALCPCGCKADLAVRECKRQRLSLQAGRIVISPPAWKIRNAAHPDHAEHGILGWATDPVANNVYVACTCGEMLAISVTRWDTMNMGDRADWQGGAAADVIRAAMREHYEHKAILKPGGPAGVDRFINEFDEAEQSLKFPREAMRDLVDKDYQTANRQAYDALRERIEREAMAAEVKYMLNENANLFVKGLKGE